LSLGAAAFLALGVSPALSGCGSDQPADEEEETSTSSAGVKLHEGLPKPAARCHTRCKDKRPTAEQRRERAQCMKPVWDEIRKVRAELLGRPPNEVKDAIAKLQQANHDAIEACDAPLRAWLGCMDECRGEAPAKP
jgi:hypothetical protein